MSFWTHGQRSILGAEHGKLSIPIKSKVVSKVVHMTSSILKTEMLGFGSKRGDKLLLIFGWTLSQSYKKIQVLDVPVTTISSVKMNCKLLQITLKLSLLSFKPLCTNTEESLKRSQRSLKELQSPIAENKVEEPCLSLACMGRWQKGHFSKRSLWKYGITQLLWRRKGFWYQVRHKKSFHKKQYIKFATYLHI